MKKLILCALAFCSAALAGPDDVLINQRNSTDTGLLIRTMTHPASNGLLAFDASTLLPGFITMGTGITISSGVLALTTPPVNPDWNAVSGLAQVLNKPTIPASQVNADWAAVSGVSAILNKPTIPSMPPVFAVGSPTARTLSLATAYQCTDTGKPCIVTINLGSTALLTLAGGTTTIGEVRIGSTSGVATGSGTAVGAYKNSLTGTLTIGLNIATDSYNTISAAVPAGWYFAARQTSGSGLNVVSAFDQAAQ